MFTSDTDEHAVKRHHALTSLIQQEADRQSGLTFARFMELALYAPRLGYYERPAQIIGRRGDYFTSVSVGPLFGELLACQFAAWLEQPAELHPVVIEAGAHDGALAADILSALARCRPELMRRLKYLLLEPSATRKAWQAQSLASFAPHVNWAESWTEASSFLDSLGSHGTAVIFANELLDAMPVHRLRWSRSDRRWMELNVRWTGDRFAFAAMECSKAVVEFAGQMDAAQRDEAVRPLWPRLPAALLNVLPDGFTIEICPAAWQWWQAAAAGLRRGRLVTFDYGFSAIEALAPHRRHGTIRSYCDHRLTDDVLARPGDQDITAHVNFSALEVAGETAGLTTDRHCSQGEFLTHLVRDHPSVLGGRWTADQARQIQTLTHPQHLGQAFRVLVQSRGINTVR